ncbi:MAG: hypothetical protein LBF16_14495 [Pseudomonadales bacterium]|nr:hypothetical protein [Pseudomonadales bacterium]
MHPIIRKTLGGLSLQYYLRQFMFGLVMAALLYFLTTQGGRPFELWFFTLTSTLLYPYSRFVYESIVGFVMGENVFFVNALLMLITKIFTMFLCWGFAWFIAPIGLVYLYYHHTKAEQE